MYGDAARMPPSSVLSTRYRTARRYPVICRGRGPTTPCHDVALLLARCGASASAGAAVKWSQFDVQEDQPGYCAARSAARPGFRVRRCRRQGIGSVDSRATLPGPDPSWFSVTSRMSNVSIARYVVLCLGGKEDPCPTISLSSRAPSHLGHRCFSIFATERKQQVCVHVYTGCSGY